MSMIETTINSRWTLKLPDFRAERVEWSDPGWEVERLASMHANLKPGDIVYDIGTEEGDLSGLYAQWGCGLVMIEPNPNVWPCIRAIWEANQFDHPLAWWTGFATNRDGALDALGTEGWPDYTLRELIRAHGFSSFAEERNSTDPMPTIKIDTLVARTGHVPNAITIDIEGAEMLALEGASGTLDSARPLVWVSVHDAMIRYDYGYTSESVHQYMASHGYRMHLLAIDHESHWVYVPAERADSFVWDA